MGIDIFQPQVVIEFWWVGVCAMIRGMVALIVSQLTSHWNLFCTYLMDAIAATEALVNNSHACFCGKLHLIALVYMF